MNQIDIFVKEEPRAVQEIENFSGVITRLLQKISSLEIKSDEQCKDALRMAAEAKHFHRQIEDIRKKSIEPSRRTIAVINDAAKHLTNQLEELEHAVKLKLSIWHKALEEEAKQAKERVAELSKEFGIEVYVADAPKTLSNEYAVASTKMKWCWSVENEDLVHREFMTIDGSKIDKAIKAGVRKIPGIKIYESASMTIRRR